LISGARLCPQGQPQRVSSVLRLVLVLVLEAIARLRLVPFTCSAISGMQPVPPLGSNRVPSARVMPLREIVKQSVHDFAQWPRGH